MKLFPNKDGKKFFDALLEILHEIASLISDLFAGINYGYKFNDATFETKASEE